MNIKDSTEEEDEAKKRRRSTKVLVRGEAWNYMSLTTPHTKRQFELLLSLHKLLPKNSSSTVYKFESLWVFKTVENGKSNIELGPIRSCRRDDSVTNTRSFPGSVLIEIEDRLLDPKFHENSIRFD